MAVNDEIYRVKLDVAVSKLIASADVDSTHKVNFVDTSLKLKDTLWLRLGTGLAGSIADWKTIRGPLKQLDKPWYRLAISAEAVLTDGKDPSVAFDIEPGALGAALGAGAVLLVTLREGPHDAGKAPWSDVAAVLEKFDLTFEADMTCVQP